MAWAKTGGYVIIAALLTEPGNNGNCSAGNEIVYLDVFSQNNYTLKALEYRFVKMTKLEDYIICSRNSKRSNSS